MKNLIAVFAVLLTVSNNCYVFEDRQDRRDCEDRASQRDQEQAQNDAQLQNLWNQASQAQTATVQAEQLRLYGIQQPANNR